MQVTPLSTLVDDASRRVFFANLHNLLALHAQVNSRV
jgi:hypothetical protein